MQKCYLGGMLAVKRACVVSTFRPVYSARLQENDVLLIGSQNASLVLILGCSRKFTICLYFLFPTMQSFEHQNKIVREKTNQKSTIQIFNYKKHLILTNAQHPLSAFHKKKQKNPPRFHIHKILKTIYQK